MHYTRVIKKIPQIVTSLPYMEQYNTTYFMPYITCIKTAIIVCSRVIFYFRSIVLRTYYNMNVNTPNRFRIK